MPTYRVTIKGGKSNTEWGNWFDGVTDIGGRQPDYGGINDTALVDSSLPPLTIHALVTGKMKKNEKDVTVR